MSTCDDTITEPKKIKKRDLLAKIARLERRVEELEQSCQRKSDWWRDETHVNDE